MPLTREETNRTDCFSSPLSLSTRVQRSLRAFRSYLRTLFLPLHTSITGHHRFASCSLHDVPSFWQRITLDVFFSCSRPFYTLFVFRNKSLFIFSRFPVWICAHRVRVPCVFRDTRWLDDRESTITVKAGSRCSCLRSSRNRMIRFGRLL